MRGEGCFRLGVGTYSGGWGGRLMLGNRTIEFVGEAMAMAGLKIFGVRKKWRFQEEGKRCRGGGGRWA